MTVFANVEICLDRFSFCENTTHWNTTYYVIIISFLFGMKDKIAYICEKIILMELTL